MLTETLVLVRLVAVLASAAVASRRVDAAVLAVVPVRRAFVDVFEEKRKQKTAGPVYSLCSWTHSFNCVSPEHPVQVLSQ